MSSLVESVPNVSEGRRLEVVDRLAAALESVPGAHLLDRTSDPSHNRSVFTLAGENDAGRRCAGAAGRRCPARDRHGGAVRRAPANRRGRRRAVRAARRDHAGGVRRVRPRLRPAHRGALRAPRLSLRGCRDRARAGEAGRRAPRPVRGPARGDRDPRPRAGLRPGPDAPARRGDVRRGAAVPHRLEHQPRLGRPRAGQADRPSDPRIVGRAARPPGEGLLHRRARVRPGVDEPPRLRADAALGGLGDGPGRGRRGWRGAGRDRADRAGAAGCIPGRGRPRGCAPGGAAGGAGPRGGPLPEAARRVAAHGAGAAARPGAGG